MAPLTDLKVLLVSPWRLDGMPCGDDVITDLLMADPPPGVTYRHFGAGLEEGWLRRNRPLAAWVASLVMHSRPPAGVRYHWEGLPPLAYRLLGKLWTDRPDLDAQWLAPARPEPLDLVHAITYPVHLDGALRGLPLILGNSSANTDLLRHYYGYDDHVTAPRVRRDRRLLRGLGIDHDLYHADRARFVVVPSHYAARLHREAGVHPDKLRVIRGAWPTPAPVARSSSGQCRFTLVGQQFWRKGGRTLLDAFARLRPLHPEARLTIVSDVREDELGVDGTGITLHSRLPRARILSELYPATDVVVLPSLAEGYGLSVVEAMGHGLPVIASRVGALPELVEEGVNGLLVTPGDVEGLFVAMRTLMEDSGLRERMGAASRAAFLREHAVEVTNRRQAEIYGEAVGRGPAGQAPHPA